MGADLARKYLQMGYTRARRYANYKGGKKYDKENRYRQLERGTGETEKAEAAGIFYESWKKAESNHKYAEQKNHGRNNLAERPLSLTLPLSHQQYPEHKLA